MFYGAKHVLPTRSKRASNLQPRNPLGPTGKEPAIGRGQLVLAVAPRNFFYFHATLRTVDPPHGINEEHGDAPHWHVLETSLGLSVVTRSWLVATRADRPPVLSSFDVYFDRGPVGVFDPFGFSVNKGLELFDAIEDSS